MFTGRKASQKLFPHGARQLSAEDDQGNLLIIRPRLHSWIPYELFRVVAKSWRAVLVAGGCRSPSQSQHDRGNGQNLAGGIGSEDSDAYGGLCSCAATFG